MTEIHWNSSAPHLPIQDHEVVELRIVDLGDTEQFRYLVREIHASWSAASQQMKWMGFEDEAYGTQEDAERSFASRKASLVSAGFPYTTTLN